MKLRAPSYPLITVDPYFSVWSPYSILNHRETKHWTGSPNDIFGIVDIDGEELQFVGTFRKFKKIPQTSVDYDALSTSYTFENSKISLAVTFMTPLFPDDPDVMTRPVSYMTVTYKKIDPAVESVKVKIYVGDSLCLNRRREMPVDITPVEICGIPAIKMGAKEQNPLNRSGDDLRSRHHFAH